MKNDEAIVEIDDLQLNELKIVGIGGASAGGLSAFETLFTALSDNVFLNMAFILVQHLSPDHKSILVDIVQGYSSMTVCEAEQDMQVKANTIYVIPPNCDMVYNEGKIGLSVRNRDTSHPLPIDIFFTSLAKELKKNAIGIVLSGTGSDGTIGLGKILDGGGMTIAQEPGSAEFSAMPLSAILAGVVKYTMPIKNMASHLYELSTLGYINSQKAETYHEGESSQFDKALLLLKDGTGHDFYDYKQSTLLRRLKKAYER